MFILDLDYISRRPMRNRDTKLLPNRQLPGQDRVVFDYLTETSLQLQNEAAHGVIYGFAAVVGKPEGAPSGAPSLTKE